MDKIEEFSAGVLGAIEDSYDSIVWWAWDLVTNHPNTLRLAVGLCGALILISCCALGIVLREQT